VTRWLWLRWLASDEGAGTLAQGPVSFVPPRLGNGRVYARHTVRRDQAPCRKARSLFVTSLSPAASITRSTPAEPQGARKLTATAILHSAAANLHATHNTLDQRE
jgi:hypothetical protein